jgi:uroporphyrinogen decarboxylase
MSLLYYTGGFFQNFDDYLQFPPLDPDNVSRERMYKTSKKIEANLKGEIFVVPYISGIMEATWEGFGIENFSKLLAKRKQIKQVFDDRGSFALELTKRIIDWGETGAIYITDDYGYKQGLFMSPNNYRKYVIPWIQEITKTAHKADLKVILHSCGDIFEIFEDLVKVGIDAINPIEPTTANPEYNIFKLHEKFGDKITFCGNLSPQMLATGEISQIEAYTKCLIQELAPGGGYIFSSGHSINPAVKLENFLAMRKILEKYGEYPINTNRVE